MTVPHTAARGTRRVGARVCNRHPQNMIPTLEKWDFFQNHTTSVAFPTAETGISGKGTWKQQKKRVVFYIQINLYFCHKTLKANRRFFNTEFCQGSPKHTVTITHRFTGHGSILQSCNYFLWTFFPSLFLTRSISRNNFAQEHRKTSLWGTWLQKQVFLALWRVFASQTTTAKDLLLKILPQTSKSSVLNLPGS